MACEQNASRVSKLAGRIGAGISTLAGKRSFYAGIAVGAAGTVGAMAAVKSLSRSARSGSSAIQTQPLPVGNLTAGSSNSAARSSGTRAKPIPISKEALSAGKSRSGGRDNPIQLSKETLGAARNANPRSGTRANPKPIPILGAVSVPLTETKLRPEAIQIRTGDGQTFTAENSYRVVRPDGMDTGLAVTPYLREGEKSQRTGDQTTWGVTHSRSGSLISGPYDTVARAQGLATQLSPLRWMASAIPAQDVEQAKQIIKRYQSSTEVVKS